MSAADYLGPSEGAVPCGGAGLATQHLQPRHLCMHMQHTRTHTHTQHAHTVRTMNRSQYVASDYVMYERYLNAELFRFLQHQHSQLQSEFTRNYLNIYCTVMTEYLSLSLTYTHFSFTNHMLSTSHRPCSAMLIILRPNWAPLRDFTLKSWNPLLVVRIRILIVKAEEGSSSSEE